MPAHRELLEIDAGEVAAAPEPAVLLDVREPEELRSGRIPGALHIPLGLLEQRVEDAIPTAVRPSSSTARPGSARSRPRTRSASSATAARARSPAGCASGEGAASPPQ